MVDDGSSRQSEPGFLERVFGINTAAGRFGCLGTIAVAILLPVIALSYCSQDSAPEATSTTIESQEDEARYQAAIRTGEVCQDGPNGAVTALQIAVKSRLKDPSSFEHIGTVVTPAANGEIYDALMRYRSKNSFGALVVGSAVGRLYVAERYVCEVRQFEVVE